MMKPTMPTTSTSPANRPAPRATSPSTLNRAARAAEKILTRTASAVWPLVKKYNQRFERPAVHPKWAPAPLLKRKERTFPQLGWPRETDSLCPRCVKEVRTRDPRRRARRPDAHRRASPARSGRTIVEEDGEHRDGEDVRQARPLRGRDVHRPGVHSRASSASTPGATSSRRSTHAPRPRHRAASSTAAAACSRST